MDLWLIPLLTVGAVVISGTVICATAFRVLSGKWPWQK